MDATANTTTQRPGEVLAAERERQGLAPADIAQKLHLSVSQIEALEAGDYARLPRGPFLRGFVRNYAKVLNLPCDGLLASLAEGGPRDPVPRIVVPSQNIRFDPLSERMSSPYVKAAGLAAVVIAIAFAAMYWWLFIKPTPPATTAQKPAASAPKTVASAVPASGTSVVATPAPAPAQSTGAVASISPAPAVTPPAPVVTPSPTPVAATPAKTTPAKATSGPATPAVPSEPAKVATAPRKPGDATLKFRFKGRSWVEIRDGAGKVLLTGLNPADSETEVSGKPPFRVIVGNASEVRMFINDREFDLEPHTREAVARLTVE